jgi:hypothetical protein
VENFINPKEFESTNPYHEEVLDLEDSESRESSACGIFEESLFGSGLEPLIAIRERHKS